MKYISQNENLRVMMITQKKGLEITTCEGELKFDEQISKEC